MAKSDGGPAFPGSARKEAGHAFTQYFPAPSGMSLRDYFAGQVIPGVAIDIIRFHQGQTKKTIRA